MLLVAMKISGSLASDMKRRMAEFHEEDPVVNLFAWFDRMTRLHRR